MAEPARRESSSEAARRHEVELREKELQNDKLVEEIAQLRRDNKSHPWRRELTKLAVTILGIIVTAVIGTCTYRAEQEKNRAEQEKTRQELQQARDEQKRTSFQAAVRALYERPQLGAWQLRSFTVADEGRDLGAVDGIPVLVAAVDLEDPEADERSLAALRALRDVTAIPPDLVAQLERERGHARRRIRSLVEASLPPGERTDCARLRDLVEALQLMAGLSGLGELPGANQDLQDASDILEQGPSKCMQ